MIHSAIVLSCVLNETYTPLLFTVTMFQVCQYLQLSQDLIGQQLLPQVVSALYNDGHNSAVMDGGQSGNSRTGGWILRDRRGSKYWRGKRRGEEVNRGKTHFWRDQAEFGVYLYE